MHSSKAMRKSDNSSDSGLFGEVRLVSIMNPKSGNMAWTHTCGHGHGLGQKGLVPWPGTLNASDDSVPNHLAMIHKPQKLKKGHLHALVLRMWEQLLAALQRKDPPLK